MAARIRRRRAEQGRSQGAGAGNARHPRAVAAVVVRHLDARAGAAQIRQRGAEAGTSAEDRARRNPLVPGLFGARRGVRPRLAADERGDRRRRLYRQRPESVDQLRRQGRLDLLPRPDRSGGTEASRHLVPAVRHGVARRVDLADQADLRLFAVLPDLLRRRPGAARQFDGRGRQGLGHRQIPADPRARDDRRPRRRPPLAQPDRGQGAGRGRRRAAADRHRPPRNQRARLRPDDGAGQGRVQAPAMAPARCRRC